MKGKMGVDPRLGSQSLLAQKLWGQPNRPFGNDIPKTTLSEKDPEALAKWTKMMREEVDPNYSPEKDPSYLRGDSPEWKKNYDEIKQPSNTSLPMDQASRMARAQEMGFDPNKTYYHGTAKNFSEFDPKFNGKHTIDSQTNTGHYFSDEPEMANVYAEMEKNGANIMPVHLKMENPNIIDLNRTSIPIFRTDLINKAKELGHDSILFKNALDKGSGPLGADIPLVFEPSQIRSVNAAFDPAKKDSKDILAGLGGAAILGSQSDEENSNFDKLKQLLQQK